MNNNLFKLQDVTETSNISLLGSNTITTSNDFIIEKVKGVFYT